MEVIKGIPVSPGVAIGRAFVLADVLERVPYRALMAADVDQELARLDSAIEATIADVRLDRDRVAEALGEEPARIFEFHIGLLSDPSLIDPIRTRISDEHVTADYAVAAAFRGLADRFRSMDQEMFRQKANDVLELDRRLLGTLVGATEDRLAEITEPVIVIAHELTTSEAASLDVSRVLAVATDSGGRTSHASIVAAALGIPVVVGCQDVTRHLGEGDEVIVDGATGVVIVHPDAESRASSEQDVLRMEGYRAGLAELAREEPITKCGTRVTLLANVAFAREIKSMIANGGDGVGLYRTEFLFLTMRTEPTEEEQYEEFRHAVELMEGRPLTFRTFDLGADKYTQERAEEPERNPFLGLRSIRYCLQNLPMFRTHLRALLRASAHGPVKIMFPLISTALELRQAKMILRDVSEELDEDGIEFDRNVPIGMMIEVPSAALMASAFASEVEFFSIGTNDLIQYTVAVDRGNERVANLYNAANPAVLKLVKAVIRTGKRFDVDTSLCGEMASEEHFTMLLIGLGLRTLSLVPSQIPLVKRVIRSVDVDQCERLARKVGSFVSERQVLNALRNELDNVLRESDGGRPAE